ncbi:hypothetical protein Tco_0439254 [Tanacetum coccineum]
MLTQQDIYANGSENRPPMLNRDNYVPWSSRLLAYAKIKPNGKLIYNFIMHGPYVRRMIPEPGNPDRKVPVAKTFHEQNDKELTEKEVKQMEVDDQAIQTILMGLPEDIYATVDSCKTAQEIWQIAQPGMNMGQDRQMQMVGGNGGNQFRQYAWQNVGNQNGYNAVHNVENQNGNGNVVPARAEGNGNRNNGNQEEAGIQLQAEEFDLMAAAGDLDEIEEMDQLRVSDDTSLSVARKFLNDVKSTIVTLQRVVKQKMTLDIHNWSSSAHQELHKIIKAEIFPIINQVDARVQNFEIQFLKEAAKFVRDFKSLAKEANESLAKHK